MDTEFESKSQNSPPESDNTKVNRNSSDSELPILRQPLGGRMGYQNTQINRTTTLYSTSSFREDPSLEKLRYLNRFFLRTNGRVDTQRCHITVENENGQEVYSIKLESAGRLENPRDTEPPGVVVVGPFDLNDPARPRDFHEAIGRNQALERSDSALYRFLDLSTGQTILTVEKENGTMSARTNESQLGVIHEDKWYKHPNFTAVIGTGSPSFLIQSTKGCIALNWLSCFNEAEFTISSSGQEIGAMKRNLANDNTEQFSLSVTQGLDINSKGLLLSASVLVYIAHFGLTGCGSSGVQGSYCCCGFL